MVPRKFRFYGVLEPTLPCFCFGQLSSCYFKLLVEFAVRAMSRKFSPLSGFDLDFSQYLCTRVCKISFCYLEFIVRAQLCRIIFSLSRVFIFYFSPNLYVILYCLWRIFTCSTLNSRFNIRFFQQLCLCLCNSILLTGVDCVCCVMQISVLRMVSG